MEENVKSWSLENEGNSPSTHQHEIYDTIDRRKVNGKENYDRLSSQQKNHANKRSSHDRDEAQIFELKLCP